MEVDTCIFGTLDHNVMAASLIHVFSTLTGKYPEKSGQSTHNPALSSTKQGNTLNICSIQNISQLLTILLVETEANLKYSELDTQHYNKFLK